MFICSFDGKAIGPNLKPVKVVMEKRKKLYLVKKKAKYEIDTNEDEDYVPFKAKQHDEFEQREGWEIVREVDACFDCAKAHGHFNNT